LRLRITILGDTNENEWLQTSQPSGYGFIDQERFSALGLVSPAEGADLALFLLLFVTGLGAVVRKMIEFAGLWGAKPQPIPEWQKNGIAAGVSVAGILALQDLIPPVHVVAGLLWLFSLFCALCIFGSQRHGYRRLSIFLLVASLIAGFVAIVLDFIGRMHSA
jgi:hypothetical protein